MRILRHRIGVNHMHPKRCIGLDQTFAGSCDRKPSVVRDGKDYCWQHDPERRKAKAKQEKEARRAKEARDDAEFEVALRRRKLMIAAGVDNLSDTDLQVIANLGGIRAMLARISGDTGPLQD